MKTPKEKATDLVNQYRMILMDEDTECGNEILCTIIAIRMALITVNEIIKEDYIIHSIHSHLSRNEYWLSVKTELIKL